MNTQFLLMAQYDGQAIIPVDLICRDYFPHLTMVKFIRKVVDGSLPLPLIRIENSQKSARGVHLQDLAAYIDDRRAEATKDFNKLYG